MYTLSDKLTSIRYHNRYNATLRGEQVASKLHLCNPQRMWSQTGILGESLGPIVSNRCLSALCLCLERPCLLLRLGQ
ncbi:hypothetical protein CU098_007180 [Rhizopus stolonifer]|uniref:Uncharacterized protein n=1 Tax=Rhizopus stolonifer TaxID=4846 RepID=A0A367KU32_RHIST|nr:hypothetical protein CU098_007180 [Rhizopus stolonifer]